MTLQHSLFFDQNRDLQDNRGWHYAWWDDAALPTPVTTNEYLYRFDKPVGGVVSSLKTITNKALTTNVTTVTTSVAHGFVVGDWVTVAMAPPDPVFDGPQMITVIGSTTTFSYNKTNANVVSAAAGGTATSASSALERIKVVASADAIIRAYLLAKAQTSVLLTSVATVNTTRDANLTAEGLTP